MLDKFNFLSNFLGMEHVTVFYINSYVKNYFAEGMFSLDFKTIY